MLGLIGLHNCLFVVTNDEIYRPMRYINQNIRSHEFSSCIISHSFSTFSGYWQGLWFFSYCAIINFLRMGAWGNCGINYIE